MRVLASFINSRTIRHELPYLLDGNSKDGDHSWTDLFNDWSDRGYPMAKQVSSINAIVCVATIAHSQWKSLITWTNLSNNGHIDEYVGESATSV